MTTKRTLKPQPSEPTQTQKTFVRVKDKKTGHHYDVHRDSLDPNRHELLKGYPDSWTARRAKPNVLGRRTPETSATGADTGDSPTGD